MLLMFTTYIFWELVSFPDKPDEDWYWPAQISYTQAFSRCLISPGSSPFDFHFYDGDGDDDEDDHDHDTVIINVCHYRGL